MESGPRGTVFRCRRTVPKMHGGSGRLAVDRSRVCTRDSTRAGVEQGKLRSKLARSLLGVSEQRDAAAAVGMPKVLPSGMEDSKSAQWPRIRNSSGMLFRRRSPMASHAVRLPWN